MNTWKGLRVVVERPKPKMRLSDDVPVTEEFRKETNDWMLKFFGTYSELGDRIESGVGFVRMSKAMFDHLLKHGHISQR